MDAVNRMLLERRLTEARKAHDAEVAELRRHLRQLEEAEYSSSGWRNVAATAAAGSFYAGRVDALTTALLMDNPETPLPPKE